MSDENRISIDFTAALAASIAEKLTALETELAFTLSLSPGDRPHFLSVGTATLPFIEQAYSSGVNHPTIISPGIDVPELGKDLGLFKGLGPIRTRVANILQRLDDTILVAGSEACTTALKVYGAAKVLGGSEGMEAEIDEMAKRWKRGKKTQKDTATTEETE